MELTGTVRCLDGLSEKKDAHGSVFVRSKGIMGAPHPLIDEHLLYALRRHALQFRITAASNLPRVRGRACLYTNIVAATHGKLDIPPPVSIRRSVYGQNFIVLMPMRERHGALWLKKQSLPERAKKEHD